MERNRGRGANTFWSGHAGAIGDGADPAYRNVPRCIAGSGRAAWGVAGWTGRGSVGDRWIMADEGRNRLGGGSGEELGDEIPVDVGQAEVAALEAEGQIE